MNFLHYPVRITPQDSVVVNLSNKANVLLMDDLNYKKYVQGKRFDYRGGLAVRNPVRFTAAYKGLWHVVVDMKGLNGTVKATVDIIKNGGR